MIKKSAVFVVAVISLAGGLLVGQSAKALTVGEILQGYDNPAGQVKGASIGVPGLMPPCADPSCGGVNGGSSTPPTSVNCPPTAMCLPPPPVNGGPSSSPIGIGPVPCPSQNGEAGCPASSTPPYITPYLPFTPPTSTPPCVPNPCLNTPGQACPMFMPVGGWCPPAGGPSSTPVAYPQAPIPPGYGGQASGTSPMLAPRGAFGNGSLVVDKGTIYLILGSSKIPFTSMKAFSGLGYSLKNVVSGNTSGYTAPPDYALSSPAMAHPVGTWLLLGRTIYYSTDAGFIPVPSWEVFTNNGGSVKLIVRMNAADDAALKTGPVLSPMTDNDSRVGA